MKYVLTVKNKCIRINVLLTMVMHETINHVKAIKKLNIVTEINVKKLKSLKQCLTATRPTSNN